MNQIFAYYCDICTDEFLKEIAKGAIIIRRRIGREDHIDRWHICQGQELGFKVNYGEEKRIKNYELPPMNINQIQAIKKGRELAKKYNVTAIFRYEPHQSMWFLEEYLNAHQKIKEDVERPSLFSKIFRKK